MKRGVAAGFFAGCCLASPAFALTEATLQASTEGIYAATVRNVTVTLAMSAPDDGIRDATITIEEDGAPVFQTERGDLFSLFFGPMVRVVEMDPRNAVPEIFISTYSGGAHCCNEVQIITKDAGIWREVSVGAFDGDPEALYPRDLNGDGMAEIKTYDNRFLYTFASYAGSSAPIRILGLKDGQIADLTTQEDFKWEVQAALDALGTAPESGEPRNSWLASYAAYQLLLGQSDPLDLAINTHDATVDWGMIRCTVPEINYACPDGKAENIGFAAALTEFLTQTGYMR
ncbi:MAG: hypothetical protein AAF940_01380 [Pseudomonadota bacterium]